MQTEIDKIKTYLGFCIKSGKATFGLDRAEALKRPPILLLADKTLSDGSMRKVRRLAEKFNCPLIICQGVALSELLHRPACKLVAVSQESLAKEILTIATNNTNFELLKEIGIGGNI